MGNLIKWFGGRKAFGFVFLEIIATTIIALIVLVTKSAEGIFDSWGRFSLILFGIFTGTNIFEHFADVVKEKGITVG